MNDNNLVEKKVIKIFDDYFDIVEKEYDINSNTIKDLKKKVKKKVKEFVSE